MHEQKSARKYCGGVQYCKRSNIASRTTQHRATRRNGARSRIEAVIIGILRLTVVVNMRRVSLCSAYATIYSNQLGTVVDKQQRVHGLVGLHI